MIKKVFSDVEGCKGNEPHDFLMDTSAAAATSGHCLMSESINYVSSCCY